MSKPNIYDKDFSERMSLIAKKLFKDNYSEFARAVGVVQPSLVRWVKGEADTSRTNLIKIAEVTNVNIEWLLTGKGEMFKSSENTSTISTPESSNVVMIPSYASVQVSAGFGSFNDGVTKPGGEEPYSDRLLSSIGVKRQHAAVFWANGSSMQPTINNGDQLLIDLSKKEIKSDNVYLIQNGSSVWVKRVKLHWDRVELLSDSKKEYEPILIKPEEAANLQIIGQVMHIGKKMI